MAALSLTSYDRHNALHEREQARADELWRDIAERVTRTRVAVFANDGIGRMFLGTDPRSIRLLVRDGE